MPTPATVAILRQVEDGVEVRDHCADLSLELSTVIIDSLFGYNFRPSRVSIKSDNGKIAYSDIIVDRGVPSGTIYKVLSNSIMKVLCSNEYREYPLGYKDTVIIASAKSMLRDITEFGMVTVSYTVTTLMTKGRTYKEDLAGVEDIIKASKKRKKKDGTTYDVELDCKRVLRTFVEFLESTMGVYGDDCYVSIGEDPIPDDIDDSPNCLKDSKVFRF